MGKLEALTPEQQAAMVPHAQAWIRRALEVRGANREIAERGIRAHYRVAGLKEPTRIVWTTSPLALAFAGPIAASILKSGASVRDSVRDSVRASVRDSVWASVRDSVRDSVWASVRDSVGASVGASVWASVGASVGASVWASVRDSVWASVGASVLQCVRDQWHLYCGGACWAEVPAWGSFFRDHCAIPIAPEALQAYEASTEAWWWWPHSDFCIVSERPNVLERDARGRLHSSKGPAIAWSDGWGVYAWHGTRIPVDWVGEKAALTPETALQQSNVELRRVACEILGWDKILSSLPHKVLAKDADPNIGTLISVDLPGAPDTRYVQAKCGTGRTVYYRASRDAKTPLEAAAESYQVTPKQYRALEVRT